MNLESVIESSSPGNVTGTHISIYISDILQGETLDVESISSKLFKDDMFIEGLSWQRTIRTLHSYTKINSNFNITLVTWY